jgi:hypothetical protein
MLATNKDLARKVAEHDHDIAVLYDYVKTLLKPEVRKRNPIGYIHHRDED